MKHFFELIVGSEVLVLFKNEMGARLNDIATGEVIGFVTNHSTGEIEFEIVVNGYPVYMTVGKLDSKFENDEVKVYTRIEELLQDNFNLSEF